MYLYTNYKNTNLIMNHIKLKFGVQIHLQYIIYTIYRYISFYFNIVLKQCEKKKKNSGACN